MRIYLASDFSRKDEMRGCREVLEATGHEVVSTWIDSPVMGNGAGTGGSIIDDSSLEECVIAAKQNISDLRCADLVILFTTGKLTRGGRLTELGMAIAWQKQIALVGPREGVFQCLPEIRRYATWRAFVIEFARGWTG